MLLRNSISKAKKLVHEALHSFKSFFWAGGYERLPNTPPFSTLAIKELDRFYHEFSEHWEGNGTTTTTTTTTRIVKEEEKEIKNKAPMRRYGSFREGDDLYNGGSFIKFGKMDIVGARQAHVPTKEEERRYGSLRRGGETGRELMWSPQSKRVQGGCAVDQRLKELEQRLKELEQMDAGNVEHVLDIEEVLHYYSRITCPSYINIFNKFFMEVYAESLAQPSEVVSGHSRWGS